MGARDMTHSAAIRSKLDHPIIDADGHTLEFQPAFLEYLKEVGGPDIVQSFDKRVVDRLDQTPSLIGSQWYTATPQERSEKRLRRMPWWGVQTKNTLDRATATLPRLLYERLDDFGIDLTILYPTIGTQHLHLVDDELRRACCRAHNNYQATVNKEYADRIVPVAVIPMNTPEEALAELEYAVVTLGMKAVLMPSYVLRPRADGQGSWYDTFCLDSLFDYDPVWKRCIELKVCPSFHSNNQGFGSRTSISNYCYNHIGHFAAAGEAIAKAAFLGGVTRRFPDLRMIFLEGGVGLGLVLYTSLIGHWKKRNLKALENYNPANLNKELFFELHNKYGGKMVEGKLDTEEGRRRALWAGNPSFGSVPVPGDPGAIDDFAACGINKASDIKDLFVPNFYFGCEADDPITAWAFDAKKNPYGAKINTLLGSDIGHWDVPDMTEVGEEAYEMVEHGLITADDFKDFVFANPVRLFTHLNKNFFKGTVVESHVNALGGAKG